MPSPPTSPLDALCHHDLAGTRHICRKSQDAMSFKTFGQRAWIYCFCWWFGELPVSLPRTRFRLSTSLLHLPVYCRPLTPFPTLLSGLPHRSHLLVSQCRYLKLLIYLTLTLLFFLYFFTSSRDVLVAAPSGTTSALAFTPRDFCFGRPAYPAEGIFNQTSSLTLVWCLPAINGRWCLCDHLDSELITYHTQAGHHTQDGFL